MTQRCSLVFLAGLLTIMAATVARPSLAHELSGFLAVEGNFFFDPPLSAGQRDHTGSLALQPEYYHEWQSGMSFTFVPFARLDSEDSERTHFDIREMNLLYPGDFMEIRAGIGKVFWGATEFVHLVDIINQTDLVESIDSEDKLGQPMVHLSVPKDWGVFDMFILPYFRERTFPGRKGRLRQTLVVDVDHPVYESAAEKTHVDFAMRYSRTIADADLGLSYFTGTSREPTLLSGFNRNSEPVLIPFYEQINQTSLDVQLVAGACLWKLETLYRAGLNNDYSAAVGGFEYTFTAVADSAIDIGIISEYAYDDRGDAATTPYENDIMLGLRLAFNDAASSEMLVGLIMDLDSSAHILSLEASHRFGDRIKATLEAGFFFDLPQDDLFYSLRDDDFLRLDMAFYF